MDAVKWVQDFLEEMVDSPETDIEFRESFDLVNKSQLAGNLKAYIQKVFHKAREEREEPPIEAKKAEEAVEQSKNVVIKAMGKKQVTEKAVK